MKHRPFFFSMICVGTLFTLIVALFVAEPILAQEQTPPPEECQCRQCHEQQYYLYDSGKWYCLCKAPMTCVHCHGGNGRETNADLAHKDMLAHPFMNDAIVCQGCHKHESQARVNELVSKAGVKNMPVAVASQLAFYTAAPQPFPQSGPRMLEFWEWFGVALMGGVLVLLAIAWRK